MGLIPAVWDIFRFQFMHGVGGEYPILGRILVKLMKFTIPFVFLLEKFFIARDLFLVVILLLLRRFLTRVLRQRRAKSFSELFSVNSVEF